MPGVKFLVFAYLFVSCWSLFCCATEGCPFNCTCWFLNSELRVPQSLEISCPKRCATESDAVLMREIDAMLASDTHLKELYIQHTSLTRIPNGVCNLTSLESLKLDHNRLVALPDDCLSRMSRLETFSATDNRIAYLQDGLFDGLMLLKEIDLRNNSIEDIGLGVFTNVSDLPRLRFIYLTNNKLTSLEPWPIIRGQALSRNYQECKDGDQLYNNVFAAHLHGNEIESLTNSVNWTYNCDEKTDIKIALCSDDISVRDFIDRYFTVEGELPCFLYRSRSDAYDDFIGAYPVLSCVLLKFHYSFAKGVAEIKRTLPPLIFTYDVYVHCLKEYFAEHFVYTLYAKNSLRNLECDINTGCPENCDCFTTPYSSMLHVHCAGVGLKEAPLNMPNVSSVYFQYLRNKTALIDNVVGELEYDCDISGNSLALLEARPYFSNMAILDASNSSIKNITVEALMALQQADEIYLHDNLLTTLPRAVPTINFSFSSLSLHGNPFDCSCEQVWLKQWLSRIIDRLENGYEMICNTPSRLNGKKILEVSDSDLCPSPDVRIIASAVVAPLVCLAAVIILLRIFRVESYKRFRFHPFDRDECAGEEMTYDVFISYAHEDKVRAKELCEFLENNGCKVCFHQRDFLAGPTVYDNMVEAVYTSKRVLCLVTPHFLQSRYCLDEFNIAQNRNAQLKKRRLIIMKYEEFDIGTQLEAVRVNVGKEQNQVPESTTGVQLDNALALRDFVTRHTYINLSVTNSWRDQLLYAMPINRLGEREEGPDEESSRDNIGLCRATYNSPT